MKTLFWLPSIIKNSIIAWLTPTPIFIKIYAPSSENERVYEQRARNQRNLLDYKAKKLLFDK